jgi:hypothetical protein
MKFKSDIEVQAGLRDGSNDIGTSGQILSSTGSQTNWIDQDSIVASEAKLVVIECKNTSGSTISKGTPVYQTGTVGATDVIEIDAADASDEDKMAAIGLLQSDLANNAFGKVVITGELLNITTSPIDGVTPVTGDTIYVKSGGGLTLTKPTGVNFIQNIGLVGKVSGGSAGSITVSSIMRSNDVPTPLYVDHTNQRLGIGVESPARTLQVNSGGANIVATFESSDTLSRISFVDSNTSSDAVVQIGADGNELVLFAGGAEHVRVDSSGNVGIGTTNPSTKLQISTTMSSTPTSNIFLDVDGSNVNGGGGSIIFNTSASAGTASGYNAKITGTREGGGTGGDSRLGFWTTLVSSSTAPQERMTITKEGNVGIGTTSPSAKLEVNGQTVINSTGLTEGFQWFNDTNEIFSLEDTSGAGELLLLSSNSVKVKLNANGNSYFNGGNVGIGTTSPSQKLHVAGNMRLQNQLYDSTNSTGSNGEVLTKVSAGTEWKPPAVTSQAASLYDLIPNGAFTTTYAFTSTAGTWAEVMEGNDIITATGTYSIQVFVDDNGVGGTQYDEYYSGTMSWFATGTNDAGGGAISEIVLHRAGHAANTGVIYLRTRETTNAETNKLKLEVMSNKTYTGASNLVFKFVRLI